MQYRVLKLSVAAALAASAAVAIAQQQPNGRDSVYADPTRPTRQAVLPADAAANARLGRDSVYASASSTVSAPVIAGATNLHRYGRGSVFAIQLDPVGDTNMTRIGRAPSESGTN